MAATPNAFDTLLTYFRSHQSAIPSGDKLVEMFTLLGGSQQQAGDEQAHLMVQLTALERRQQSTEQQLNDHAGRLEELSQVITDTRNRSAEFDQRLHQLLAETHNIREVLVLLEQQIQRLQVETDTTRSLLVHQDKRIDDQQADLHEFAQRIKQIQEQIENLTATPIPPTPIQV